MKKNSIAAVLMAMLFSCNTGDSITNATTGDYTVKEYGLERDPKTNVWGAGIDFIHPDSEPDFQYLTENSDFPYDAKFYTVKVYYTDNKGDKQTEGCPAILLPQQAKGCLIGEGLSFFNDFTQVSSEIIDQLKIDHQIDYESIINEKGQFNRELLFAQLDSLIIGQRFRTNVLVIPENITEEEVQPVFLIKTVEGGYAKFMVRRFKGEIPDEKLTIVRWQVISE